jgi:cytochrome bd-type quinol oxidase subunit 2
MRWKLLVIASFTAAFLACGLWSALVIGVFGTARDLARNDWLLFSSAILPLVLAAYSGMFVYRHTARRRKTQAALTVMLALFFAAGAYAAASILLPNRLMIARPNELQRSR